MGKTKRRGLPKNPEAESLGLQRDNLVESKKKLEAEVQDYRRQLKCLERQWQDLIKFADRIPDPAQSAIVIDSENLAVSFERLFHKPYNSMAAALAVDYLVEQYALGDTRAWYYASANDDAFSRLLNQHAYTTNFGTDIKVVMVGHRSIQYNTLDVWLVSDVYRRVILGELPGEQFVLISGDSDYCVMADFLAHDLGREVIVAHLGQPALSHVYATKGIETVDLAPLLRGMLGKIAEHDRVVQKQALELS